MENFGDLSFRKQKRHLKRLDNAWMVADLLKKHVVSMEVLEVIIERLTQLDKNMISSVIHYPLRHAIEQGNVPQVKLLVPFHTYHPHSDLLLCMRHNQFDIFEILFTHTSHDKPLLLNKVLADVALTNNVEGVKYLIKQGGDPSHMNLLALRGAIESKSFAIVDILIEHSDVIHYGQAALNLSARKNHLGVTQKLLEAGAPYNEDNCVALKAAIVNNNRKMIDLLLQYGPIFPDVMVDAFCDSNVNKATLEKLWNHCNIEQLRIQSHTYTPFGLERFEALYTQHQKQLLLSNLNDNATQRSRKM